MSDREIAILAQIHAALGVNEKPMLSELPDIARSIKQAAERYEKTLKMIVEMTDIQTDKKDKRSVNAFAQVINIINGMATSSLYPRKQNNP